MTTRRWAAAVAVLFAAACASTALRDSWMDPGYAGGPMRKILVVAVHRNATERRVFEDVFSSEVGRTGAQATAGWRLIPEDRRIEERAWNAAVEASGADGLLLVRLVGVDRRVSVTPTMVPAGPVYGYGWGYYSAWVAVTDVRQYDVATVETRLFDVHSRRLVWSGVTETFDPASVAKETPGFANVILTELARRGLVPHPPA